MDIILFTQAVTKFIVGFIVVSLLLFIPAGTLDYWNAWIFIGILFIPMFIAGIILMVKNPALLRKRLNAKEKETDQKVIDTGLYGIVRHPMYSSTILLFLSMPLVLGSFISFFIFSVYLVIPAA